MLGEFGEKSRHDTGIRPVGALTWPRSLARPPAASSESGGGCREHPPHPPLSPVCFRERSRDRHKSRSKDSRSEKSVTINAPPAEPLLGDPASRGEEVQVHTALLGPTCTYTHATSKHTHYSTHVHAACTHTQHTLLCRCTAAHTCTYTQHSHAHTHTHTQPTHTGNLHTHTRNLHVHALTTCSHTRHCAQTTCTSAIVHGCICSGEIRALVSISWSHKEGRF